MSPYCVQGKICMLCVAIDKPCKLRLIEIFCCVLKLLLYICHILKHSLFIKNFTTNASQNNWYSNTCVLQVMYGKCKMVTAQSQTGAAMEPTPNFDCHMSQEKPNPNDPFNMQITKSMVIF